MLNPRLCSKCAHGTVEEPEYDDDGNKIRLWSVECALDTTHFFLLTRHDPPAGCPYLLEHQVMTENMKKEDADYSSEFDDEKMD